MNNLPYVKKYRNEGWFLFFHSSYPPTCKVSGDRFGFWCRIQDCKEISVRSKGTRRNKLPWGTEGIISSKKWTMIKSHLFDFRGVKISDFLDRHVLQPVWRQAVSNPKNKLKKSRQYYHAGLERVALNINCWGNGIFVMFGMSTRMSVAHPVWRISISPRVQYNFQPHDPK